MFYRTGLTTPVFGLRREIDRLFDDTFGRGDGVNNWVPAVDIRETEKELSLDVELPGIRPEDVEITAENGVLTLRGEKHGERKEGEEGSRYHMVERTYGSFTRSFQLPQGLDDSKIEASYNDGVLSIQIPKTALAQPRKIQIGRRSQNQMSSGTAQKQMGSGNANSGENGNTAKGSRTSNRQTTGANA